MKLRTILSRQTIGQLRRIAANTGLSAGSSSGKSALIDLLCRHLPDSAGVGARLEAVTPSQREFATALAAEGGELLRADALQELGDGFAHRFQGLLRSLSDAGLVFQDTEAMGPTHPLVGIPDPLLESIPIPETDRGRIRSVMRTISIGLLRAFAKELGVSLPDTRRPFVVRAIRNHLLDMERLMAYVNGLSEEKRAILDFMLKNGEVTQEEIQARMGKSAVRELDEMLWKTPLLLFPKGHRIRKNSPIRLATDLCQILFDIADSRGGQLEAPPEEALKEAPEAPGEVYGNVPYLLQDLATLLGLVGQKRPRVLKRGGISKGDLRKVGQFCRAESDSGYPEFLILFLETSGMVRPEGRFWRPTEDAAKGLEREMEIRKALLAFWRETERWNEWASDRSASTGRRDRMEELKSLRREVLKGLRHCPEGCWISYHRFYHLLIRSSGPFRHFAEHPATGRTLSAGGTTADELLRRMLRGALTWMGLIELGNPEDFSLPLHKSERAAFQITPLGEALLDDGRTGCPPEAAPRTNPEARFVLQPNLDILSPPDLPYPVYIELCSLADLKSIDVMARFQVSREAFQQAMNRGMSGSAIRSFLKAHSATGLPEMVEAILEECESKHGEIEIGPASGYLTAARGALLDELYAQERVAAHLGPRLSPVSAVLNLETRSETLLQVLQQQGYMPRLTRESEQVEDGHHTFTLRTSELSELIGFTEAAFGTLVERTSGPHEEIAALLKRLRRGLRQVSDRRRQEALSRYLKAFEMLFRPPQADDGMPDLLRFPGANPATGPSEIRSLVGYAIDHRLCVEIDYASEGRQGAGRRDLEPLSEDHAMLYAFCRNRKGDRVFRLDKIRSARLTGDRF